MEVTDKRDRSRYRPRGMDCNLGQVVDLSATGMRLMSRRRLKGEHTVTLQGLDGQPMHLQARVLWHRQHATSEHVHGLRFERLSPEQQNELDHLVIALSSGAASKPVADFAGYGAVGAGMLAAAFALMLGAIAWTAFRHVIEDGAPGMHHALSQVPELSALLTIAAGGCGLLGLAQRLAPQTAPTGAHKRYEAQAELDRVRRSQNILNCILESSLGGVCVLQTTRDDKEQHKGFQIQLINPAGEQLIGKSERELIGQTIEEALPELVSHAIYQDLHATAEHGKPLQKEYEIGDDGRWYLVAMVRLADGIAVTFLDHTESQKSKQKLKHIAYHDELTGLPNRKALIEHVDSSLDRCRRTPGHNAALLFLDFDRFKNVNDTLGHEAGDQLLINIAARLNDNLREGDAVSFSAGECMPARLGGDEFVVLLDGIHSKEDALTVAQRLLTVFKEPHDIVGQQVVSTASIGIAVNQGEYEQAEDILRDADAALYIAKQNGKARYVLFDQDMQDQIIQRIRMEQDLKKALENNEFSLVYEPIIDLQVGTASGFEALIRWTHPEHGSVSPAVFIPIAESINLIGEIGRWVIEQTAEQLARWREMGLDNVFLNINVSRGQLYEPDLVDQFQLHLDRHGLNPSNLRLELTETMVMNDLEFMGDKLSQLKALGLGLALDDFGTGYSSLSVLHKLPFDTLKIDRAFLEDARAAMALDQTHRSSAIISAITQLAEHLRLSVIAEGIAEQQQVATLQALACQYAQGWFFSKPLSSEQATEMLQNPVQQAGCLASLLDGDLDQPSQAIS
ncbi:MAG: EAL domain-containing protein [Phycisphaeraceae bacterium]